MNLQQMEAAILASLFVDRGVKGIVKPELTEDKFSYGPGGVEVLQKSHSLIYRAMVKVPGRIDVLSVAKELGNDLDKVGGESYLQFLATACLPQLGVRSTEGLPQWVIAIDTGGRLRQLTEIITDYDRMFDNFQSLVTKIEDVDSLAADMIEKINRVVLGTASTQYKHISVATSDYQRKMEDEARGFVHTYYPCGWPSFEKYGIPPQSALMVISGLSSMGKTQLMLQLALGVAIQIKAAESPGTVVINSYEMKGWRNARRLAACLAAVDYQSLALRNEGSDEYRKMCNALEFIETLPIYYDDSDMTSAQIALQASKISAQVGPIIFLGVDYAEEVPDERKQSEELRVSGIFGAGKRLSQSMDLCYCLLSQVSDISQFMNGIVPYNRLRYSRGATNKADVICYLYNPPQMRAAQIPFTFADELGDDSFAYVCVQKHRDGKLGAFPLEWTADITRFRDPSMIGFSNYPLYRNLHKLGFVNGVFEMEDF